MTFFDNISSSLSHCYIYNVNETGFFYALHWPFNWVCYKKPGKGCGESKSAIAAAVSVVKGPKCCRNWRTFPCYQKFRLKEAGLYLPDPANDITGDKFVHVC